MGALAGPTGQPLPRVNRWPRGPVGKVYGATRPAGLRPRCTTHICEDPIHLAWMVNQAGWLIRRRKTISYRFPSVGNALRGVPGAGGVAMAGKARFGCHWLGQCPAGGLIFRHVAHSNGSFLCDGRGRLWADILSCSPLVDGRRAGAVLGAGQRHAAAGVENAHGKSADGAALARARRSARVNFSCYRRTPTLVKHYIYNWGAAAAIDYLSAAPGLPGRCPSLGERLGLRPACCSAPTPHVSARWAEGRVK